MIHFLPVIVCAIGLAIYFASDGKPSEIGRIMFWTGLFITLWKGIG